MSLTIKFTSILFLIISFGVPPLFAKPSECKDFLQQLTQKPTELKYQSCKKVEEAPAVLLKATYEVSGKKAKEIENFLHKEFGLKRLRFACCGWETSPSTYNSKNGDTYSIQMYSLDEFNFQEKWEDYKAFSVTVGKYIVLP